MPIDNQRLTHYRGEDGLGFNIRKYKGKLLIKPDKQRVKSFLKRIYTLIRENKTSKAIILIRQLNSKLRGWSNYYRHVVSKAVFKRVEHCIFWAIWRWCKRRHPNKSCAWIKNKYFLTQNNNSWIFFDYDGKKPMHLMKISAVPIRRHIKIKGMANPYEPKWFTYFQNRANKKAGSAPAGL